MPPGLVPISIFSEPDISLGICDSWVALFGLMGGRVSHDNVQPLAKNAVTFVFEVTFGS